MDRTVEQGGLAGATGFFGGGRGPKPGVASLANLKELEVELDINEADIPRVRLGQQCSVSPDSYPDRKYKAVVREIAPEANRAEGDDPGEGRDPGGRQLPAPRDQREGQLPNSGRSKSSSERAAAALGQSPCGGLVLERAGFQIAATAIASRAPATRTRSFVNMVDQNG